MANATTLAQYDNDRALFKEFSTFTDGKKDFWGNGVDRIGRRHILRMKTTNNQGVEISVWMFLTDLTRAVKTGALEVLRK